MLPSETARWRALLASISLRCRRLATVIYCDIVVHRLGCVISGARCAEAAPTGPRGCAGGEETACLVACKCIARVKQSDLNDPSSSCQVLRLLPYAWYWLQDGHQ